MKSVNNKKVDDHSMRKYHPAFTISGFILLSVMVIILLVPTVYHALESHLAGGLIALIVLIGATITIYHQGRMMINDLKSNPQSQPVLQLKNFIAVFIGGIIAFILSQDIGLGAVVAVSLVAIVAHLVLPEFGVPAYCGAFVGMTSELLLFSHGEVALASAAAGVVYILTEDVFKGFGGKLGTIALIGTVSTGVGLGRQFLTVGITDWQTSVLIILIALIASPLTYYLSIHRKNGPVLASGFVSLIGGLLLPILFPQIGVTLAVVGNCASFTGMTSRERCPSFWHIVVAGLFTGIVFVFSAPLLGGAGGKLGTIAFASVLSTCGYSRLYHRLQNRISQDQTDPHY